MGDGDANEDNSEDGDEDCSDDGGGADEGADAVMIMMVVSIGAVK